MEGLKSLLFFFLFLLRHVYCYNWPKRFNSHKDVSPPVSGTSEWHRVTSLRSLLTSASAINTHAAGAAHSRRGGRGTRPSARLSCFYIYTNQF